MEQRFSSWNWPCCCDHGEPGMSLQAAAPQPPTPTVTSHESAHVHQPESVLRSAGGSPPPHGSHFHSADRAIRPLHEDGRGKERSRPKTTERMALRKHSCVLSSTSDQSHGRTQPDTAQGPQTDARRTKGPPNAWNTTQPCRGKRLSLAEDMKLSGSRQRPQVT